MAAKAHKVVIRRSIQEAWNQGNVGIIDEVMATHYARYMGVGRAAARPEGTEAAHSHVSSGFP